MAYNTQDILGIIAANPGIRQVEIADKADCDMDAVLWALKDALANGDVIQTEVIAPNNRMQPCFTLRVGVVLKKPKAPVSPKHIKPVIKPVAERKKSRQVLALEYLQKHASATTEELRAAINLFRTQSITIYLKPSLDRGDITFIDNIWRSKEASDALTANTENPIYIEPIPEFFQSRRAFLVQANDSIMKMDKELSTTWPTPDHFSCALTPGFNMVRLFRNDQLIATLQNNEVQQLAHFMSSNGLLNESARGAA